MFNGKITKSLLYERTTDRLLRMIEAGSILPGNQFPTERELVKELGISRNVLREAFHILEERGLVTSVQGKGRFLRQIPLKEESEEQNTALIFDLQKTSLIDIYSVRKVLELKVMEELARYATPEALIAIENFYKKLCHRFAETLNTKGEIEMHIVYADNCPNYYLRYLMHMTLDNILMYMGQSFSTVVDEYQVSYCIEDHKKIINALKFHDVYAAQEALSIHLSRTSNRLDSLSTRDFNKRSDTPVL